MARIIVLLLCLLIPNISIAEVKFTEKQDDFSNEKVYSLSITSEKQGNGFSGGVDDGVIFISCFPNNNLQVQFHTQDTIFPDKILDGTSGMLVSVTYKFDKAESAQTDNWFMNFMKYQDAWFKGDKKSFVEQTAKSNILNFRLNKRNDKLKFKLNGTSKPINTILKKCKSDGK